MPTMSYTFPSVRRLALTALLALSLLVPLWGGAQTSGETLALTVTPPLYQVSVSPGETWSSSLAIVNSNNYPLTLYVTPVGFEAQDEFGRPRLVPAPESSGGLTLPEWILIGSGQITVPPGSTERIPFSIVVPEDASPGGHYASLLVATEPPEPTQGGEVTITSSVASLILMRVAGEVEERGLIRDFFAEPFIAPEAAASFTMRFQNTGNVHLRPQGIITIENMWGQERGQIAINQATNFGNVLPEQTRRFTFSWQGSDSTYDFGRYRAIATISYGSGEKHSVTREAIFWIVPVWDIVRVGGGILLALVLLVWLVRMYVRRALRLEAQRLGIPTLPRQDEKKPTHEERAGVAQPAPHTPEHAEPHTKPSLRLGTLVRPLTQGAVDLRRSLGARDVHQDGEAARVEHAPYKKHEGIRSEPSSTRAQRAAQHQAQHTHEPDLSFATFLVTYRYFFLFLILLGITFIAGVHFFSEVFAPSRDFEIEIQEPDGRFVPAAAGDLP